LSKAWTQPEHNLYRDHLIYASLLALPVHAIG
jgi:hypothetical protein